MIKIPKRIQNALRTFSGYFIKVKFKSDSKFNSKNDFNRELNSKSLKLKLCRQEYQNSASKTTFGRSYPRYNSGQSISNFVFLMFLVLLSFNVKSAFCNRPPRFLIDGQPEIVLRLEEGQETPVGTILYSLKAHDPDDDVLHFGVKPSSGSDVIRLQRISDTEANVYLNKDLDREERDEYSLVLTLTDGHLGQDNYVTQSLLILVEDINDNTPIFRNNNPSVSLPEDAQPRIIATLEATDADIGPYGQVVYHLDPDVKKDLFSVSTAGEKAIVRLIGSLDYEKQTLHQVKVLAVDRAKGGRVNTGTAVLLVKVEDVEDQPPEFVKVTPVARIAENVPTGTAVLQVTAVDGDRGINNKIRYTLASNDVDQVLEIFSIEEDSGKVITTAQIDREAMPLGSNSYILQIMATEVGGKIIPPPYVTTEVTVIVTDENDESPTFADSFYECEIAENSPKNTPLSFTGNASPEVFDYDQGINGTFQLYIKGPKDVFDLYPRRITNEATFIVKVKNSTALDFERTKKINFTIIAKEVVKNSPKSSYVPVVVYILDRNDNYPEFSKSYYEVSVPENCEVGTTVANIRASDRDSGNLGSAGIRFTGISGSIAYMLNLHPISGIVTVKAAGGPNWDREVISKHFLTIEARDDVGHGNRNSVPLIINLEDLNDNPPIFIQSRYEAKVLEGRSDFEYPLRVEAHDSDLNGTKNSEIEYYLTGDFHENFTIDSSTGEINLKYPLDFELIHGPEDENVRILKMMVRARDWGTPSLFSDVPLLVYVEDTNDNAPIFEAMYYNATISEDSPGGKSIITVKAFDYDGSMPNNRIVYRIQNGALDKFSIDSESGVVSVAYGANLDPDLTNPRETSYTLNVVALDGGAGENQLHAAVTVEINVMDVNNKNPVIMQPNEITVKENSPVGVPITKINATDLDESAKLVYILNKERCEARNEDGIIVKAPSFECASFFSINPQTGLLIVAKLIDREVVEVFRLRVIVQDENSETGMQIDATTITIIVDDINDNSPKFSQPFYKFLIQENTKFGLPIGLIAARDPDKNKTITYTLNMRNDYAGLIHLDNQTGELIVANKIDHEIFQWLNFTVKATDSGYPSRSSRLEVFLQILDENDNSPIFYTEPRRLVLPEDIMVGSQVAIINATDLDSGEFGKITYFMDRMSSHDHFSIDSNTGIITVSKELDREKMSSYLLIIEAWDNYQYGFASGDSRNTFKQLNVTILDVNDNTPKLYIESKCINVTEFFEPGEILTTLHANDEDDPETPNGQVVMDIASASEPDLFELEQISETEAVIRSINSLRGLHGNYTLLIRAQDLGTPSYSVEKPLKICVIDYNDHAPKFISPPHNSTLRIPENATRGSALIQFKAIDEDIGLNGAVRYKLKPDPAGDWKAFDLQPVSGILELKMPLNRKRQKIYDIRVEAYDLGRPTSLSSDLDLTIYVTDVHEFQPSFMNDEFVVEFTENLDPGLEIIKLPKTIERDEIDYDGPPEPVCYFIIGGNENKLFYLDPYKHILSITKPLDREDTDLHLILVKATENCHTPPERQNSLELSDETQLKVIIKVIDQNDNPPKFTRRIFTGGVSTATPFGTKFMQVKAIDADIDENAIITYYSLGKIKMTLAEGLENLVRPPFLVEKDTGEVILNFDPQQGMKGYFDFMVLANDTGGLKDTARVFIYLLREDQRVRFVLRQHAPELRSRIEMFRDVLGNVTGAIVNVDEFRTHTTHDGTRDKTRTDLFLHLVNRRDNSILEVAEVLRLIDQNTEKLDALFKEFNVLDTQPGVSFALQSKLQNSETTFWLTAASLFLLLLLILCLTLCINQRHAYHRKLKAATATAYVSAGSDIDSRGMSIISGRVPNTNKHSMEVNPIWLKAYENDWFNNSDHVSNDSDHDSLDENVICSELTDPCGDDLLTGEENVEVETEEIPRQQNLYQSLPVPMPRKMETTEL